MGDREERREYFNCPCFSPDHLAVFTKVKWDEEEPTEPTELYIDLFLHKEPSFFKRLKTAFKYLFSRWPCRYGNVDQFCISPTDKPIDDFWFKPNDIYRLLDFLEDYKKTYEHEKATLKIKMEGF